MLSVETHGSWCSLRLNRPEVRNAFNEDLIAALTHAFQDLDPATRVVVLAGEGKAFCAGGDLAWMRRMSERPDRENQRDAEHLARLFQTIAHCPALTVASVHGAVYGGGLGLTAACDVAIAHIDTRFCFSEVRLGLIPATISTVVTPKIGSSAARWLYATAQEFNADVALRIGLVHEICTTESQQLTRIQELIGHAHRLGPQAVCEAKRLVLEPPTGPSDAANRLAHVRAGSEAREGLDAFLTKRPPTYVQEPQP